jgi:alkylation response protein AidB-like acyl-CoA dehydrogenase
MKQIIQHPSAVIEHEYVERLRKYASVAEEKGMLLPEQLDVIYSEQWFKLLAPAAYGGLEVTLPDLVRLQEAVSWTDGSIGWVLTLCCGAGWFGGFISPDTAREVFRNPKVCLAGSGASNGEAEITENGYRINGTWKHASGAHHATHFTANCLIKKDGERVLNHDGGPLVLPFIIDQKDVTLLQTWKYVGMVATGSQSFQVKDVEVSNNRCFKIGPRHAQVNARLYQYPFLQLAEATLAVNLSGMAIHFADLCRDVFRERKQQPRLTENNKAKLEQVLQNAIVGLQSARNDFFAAVDASWQNPGDAELKAVSKTSRHLAITAREAVDQLYPYCGLIAASPDTEINQVWRDIHTAGQHSLLTFAE